MGMDFSNSAEPKIESTPANSIDALHKDLMLMTHFLSRREEELAKKEQQIEVRHRQTVVLKDELMRLREQFQELQRRRKQNTRQHPLRSRLGFASLAVLLYFAVGFLIGFVLFPSYFSAM